MQRLSPKNYRYRFSFRPFLHNVPLFANYVEANVLASSAISLLTGPRAKGLNDTNIEKLWRVLKKVVLEPRTKTVLSGTNTINDLIKIMHLRGTAELESEPRSLEWLEEYGEKTVLLLLCYYFTLIFM